ncbi:hypothetical protein AB0C52_12215 [Streptomyces sp. NPDC048717]|uniref:hypothetical protein n=1 Tax=Streptomyces sp. NPDC048717 TaxID=3154928 RepID=UPI003426134D
MLALLEREHGAGKAARDPGHTYHDVTAYKEAVAVLRQEQNDPNNQIMCGQRGWTFGMICPECSKGRGCSVDCAAPGTGRTARRRRRVRR